MKVVLKTFIEIISNDKVKLLYICNDRYKDIATWRNLFRCLCQLN